MLIPIKIFYLGPMANRYHFSSQVPFPIVEYNFIINEYNFFLILIQECNSKEAIVKTALGFLDANTLQGEKWHLPYQYCRPSLIKYAPHQWLWDDCAHMIVLSHFDTSRATR